MPQLRRPLSQAVLSQADHAALQEVQVAVAGFPIALARVHELEISVAFNHPVLSSFGFEWFSQIWTLLKSCEHPSVK